MVRKPRAEPARRAPKPRERKRSRRRRCKLESCRALFAPVRSNQLFCSTAHKDEFRFKSESFRRTKDEVLKLVAGEVGRRLALEIPRIAREVWLQFETAPPPAFVARVTDRIFEQVAGLSALQRLRMADDEQAALQLRVRVADRTGG